MRINKPAIPPVSLAQGRKEYEELEGGIAGLVINRYLVLEPAGDVPPREVGAVPVHARPLDPRA